MTLSYKNKLYIQIGALVAIIGTSAWGSVFLFGLITKAGTVLYDAQNELASLSVRQEQVASIAREYDVSRELFSPLEERLLPREERLLFIMLVEILAGEAGVSHEINAADDAPATAKDASPLYFNITVSGGFPDVARFMYLLEHSQYYLSIEKAQISQGGGPAGPKKNGIMASPDDVRAQLNVKVYTR